MMRTQMATRWLVVAGLLCGTAAAYGQTVAIDGQTTDGTSSISRLQIYTTTSVGAIATVSLLQSRMALGSSAYLNLSTSTAASTAGDIRYSGGNILFYDGTAAPSCCKGGRPREAELRRFGS